MKKLRIWATVTLSLGILGLVFMLFMFLALADIYHGEQDASLEWGILRLGFLVIFFLIVATFICTGLVFKHFREKDDLKEPNKPD